MAIQDRADWYADKGSQSALARESKIDTRKQTDPKPDANAIKKARKLMQRGNS